MNQIKALERAALDAFRNGQGWNEFWEQHGNTIRQCEPYNRQRFKRLYDRLLSIEASGR